MKIGIFGGTFNPPHIGHTKAAQEAKEQMGLDLIIFVPSNIPPHKVLPKNTANNEQRLEMTKLAAQTIGAKVSDIEIKGTGTKYTRDTIRELALQNPNDSLYFIMGTDMINTFLQWKNPEEIVKYCGIIGLCRQQSQREQMEKSAQQIRDVLGAEVYIVNNEVLEVSSTDIRMGDRSKLCPQVAEYIEQNNLYL